MPDPVPEASVSFWLDQLKAGDPNAAQPLWERYFERLVRLARPKLNARIRRVADEEDVVVNAFDSFVRAVGKGRFPKLADRDDLWRVLVTLTERKVYALADWAQAGIRGGKAGVRGDSVFGDSSNSGGGAANLPAPDPTPAFAAEVAEQCAALLDRLAAHDPGLRDYAVWKLEGYTNAEIAEKTGKSLATVERKLAVIRSLWSTAADTSTG